MELPYRWKVVCGGEVWRTVTIEHVLVTAGPPGTPGTTAQAVEAALDAAARVHATPLGADGPARLRERMEILGIAPAGPASAGGTCRLLPAADGRWVAVNLARRDDVELLAAWMGHDWDGPVWDAVAGALAGTDAVAAVDRAQLLGIPAAVAVAPGEYVGAPAVTVVPVPGEAPPAGAPVVDLSSLWAGPLCAGLVGDALSRPVLKVESAQRPDGARRGAPEFWARLNGGKDEVTVDLDSAAGRGRLHELVHGAAVVVAASRPRAFVHLGIDPVEVARGGTVWVSITGYGWSGPDQDRVAFGDDAAVAGGAAVAAGGSEGPVFVLDAVADPLSGLAAARTAVETVERAGAGAFVDVCMAGAVNGALAGFAVDRPARGSHYASDRSVPGDRGVT
jgi:hypothetical protein